MHIDPGIVEFYFWIHIILLFIFGGMLLYGYGEDPEEKGITPKDEDEDEGWPGW